MLSMWGFNASPRLTRAIVSNWIWRLAARKPLFSVSIFTKKGLCLQLMMLGLSKWGFNAFPGLTRPIATTWIWRVAASESFVIFSNIFL